MMSDIYRSTTYPVLLLVQFHNASCDSYLTVKFAALAAFPYVVISRLGTYNLTIVMDRGSFVKPWIANVEKN